MRFVCTLLLAGGLVAIPALAFALGSNCCQHQCPYAKSATEAGYQVVKQLPLATIELSELES